MIDAITLTVPFERPYQGVVRLVVGGLGARLDLPIEVLEDLQLAVETVLANEAYAAGDAVQIEIEVDETALALAVGPLEADALAADLRADADDARGIGLGRVLGTVMGEYGVERRDGDGWLRMRREIPAREATA